jgi:hypothetical protein
MLTTVEGVYENGRVELAERPAGVERAKVYVTFVKEVEERVGAAERAGTDAIDRWLASMREGLALGGPPYPRRDELYDRGR